jgi:hypothetical protein
MSSGYAGPLVSVRLSDLGKKVQAMSVSRIASNWKFSTACAVLLRHGFESKSRLLKTDNPAVRTSSFWKRILMVPNQTSERWHEICALAAEEHDAEQLQTLTRQDLKLLGPTVNARLSAGKALRKSVPRASHAKRVCPANRPDQLITEKVGSRRIVRTSTDPIRTDAALTIRILPRLGGLDGGGSRNDAENWNTRSGMWRLSR